MKHKKILITGGAGFVGSNLAIKLKENYTDANIICLDNLTRRGSELNLPRLKKAGVRFVHGDIRNPEDLDKLGKVDLLIECSAEPSVMAGITSSPKYLLNTNLVGAINCFEFARSNKTDVVFLSTSRVYPIAKINSLKSIDERTRFSLTEKQIIQGISEKGISEEFPLDGVRSLYGTTKLAAELLLQEYIETYGIRGVINRCGLLTGPWQMGKVDQGIVALWVARHYFKRDLSYIGFGGEGKQVRDVLHVDDLYRLIKKQISQISKFNGQIFNVGGGMENSISLQELTKLCQEVTGNKVKIHKITHDRRADIRIYISDNSKIQKLCGWKPKVRLGQIITHLYSWITEHEKDLKPIFA